MRKTEGYVSSIKKAQSSIREAARLPVSAHAFLQLSKCYVELEKALRGDGTIGSDMDSLLVEATGVIANALISTYEEDGGGDWQFL